MKPSNAPKATRKSAALRDEPARALDKKSRPNELTQEADLPQLSDQLNPPVVTSEGTFPNLIQLAAVPELQQDELELIWSDFDLRAHKEDLNEAMTNAAVLYWRDRSARKQEHMGTGERRKAAALKKLVKGTMGLLKDPKLRNRLYMVEPPIPPEHFERLSGEEKLAVVYRWQLDAIRFRQRRSAFFADWVDPGLIGDQETQMATILKGDTVKAAERVLGELEAIADLALKVDTTKPKGNHIALRLASSCLGQFWMNIGRSTSLVSGGGPSKFTEFLTRSLSLIAQQDISEEVAIRACSPQTASTRAKKPRSIDKRQK